MHVIYWDDPPQLRFDLLDDLWCAAGDNGNSAGVPLMIHFRNSQALNIITPSRKKADDARQDARFIGHKHSQSVTLVEISMTRAQVIGGFRRRAFGDVQCVHVISP